LNSRAWRLLERSFALWGRFSGSFSPHSDTWHDAAMRIPLFTAAVVLITSLACGGAPAPAPEDKVEASAEPAAVVVTIPNLRFDGVYRSEGDETSRYLRPMGMSPPCRARRPLSR